MYIIAEDRVKYFVPLKLLYSWSAPSSDTCLQALMSALENTSKDYILHYTSSPKCQSNVIIQLNGSISSSYLQTYEAVSSKDCIYMFYTFLSQFYFLCQYDQYFSTCVSVTSKLVDI